MTKALGTAMLTAGLLWSAPVGAQVASDSVKVLIATIDFVKTNGGERPVVASPDGLRRTSEHRRIPEALMDAAAVQAGVPKGDGRAMLEFTEDGRKVRWRSRGKGGRIAAPATIEFLGASMARTTVRGYVVESEFAEMHTWTYELTFEKQDGAWTLVKQRLLSSS